MTLKSSSRAGARVIWLAVHTAEGPYDDDPADPTEDPGSADQLRDYFSRPDVRASSHAIADDDRLLDGLVPYDRASWTLRGGNSRSDNLELCGRAGWTRETWLTHTGMLRNCARWLAERAQARGWSELERIGAVGVRGGRAGVIGHVDYTHGANDGTHWDPGPGFPWDVVLRDANKILAGGTTAAGPNTGGPLMALNDDEQVELLALTRANSRVLNPLAQRMADVERRQLAINTQEQARDAADEQRDEALAAELAAARADLAKLLEGQTPPPALDAR